jgi:hypothetical protein
MKHLFQKRMNEHKELLDTTLPHIKWKNKCIVSSEIFPLYEGHQFSVCNKLTFRMSGQSDLTGNLCEIEIEEWELDNDGEIKINFNPKYNHSEYWQTDEENYENGIFGHIDGVVHFFETHEGMLQTIKQI